MDSDELVVGTSEMKKLEDCVRELERMPGRKTMEVEILREALSKADSKNGYEFSCWNGEVIRLAFIIDAFDREIIAWTAVANAGISGSDVRDLM